MRGKKIGLKFAGAALLAALSLVAQAGDYDGRWYVTPMVGGIFADRDRGTKDGPWGAIGVGVVASRHVNLELEFSADNLNADVDEVFVDENGQTIMLSGPLRHFAGELGALVFLSRDATIAPFVRLGIGALHSRDERYPLGGPLNDGPGKTTGLMASAGFGVLANLSERLGVRAEARYRHDPNRAEDFGEQYFGDYIAALGVQYTFGQAAVPAAAAAPVPPPVPAAPADTDGDGVPDTADKCPNTPAGAKVDADGCEPKVEAMPADADGDGVTDDKDLCPDTPAGTKVNATGCAEEVGFVIKGINFATGSAKLTPESTAILDRVAEKLLANPGIKIAVDGHTDSTGSKAGNTRLSKARAQAVVDYFAGKGVSADNLVARGFGPDRPVADNKTAAGRAKNRRVEINTVN